MTDHKPLSEGEMTLDIEAIQARADAATPAPWDTLGGTRVRAIKGDLAVPIFQSETPIDWHKKKNVTHSVLCRAYADEVNNATFIAHARTDIPALIAEIERLRATPKPLDGEAERLCSELRDEAQRVREIIADHWQIDPDVLDRAADAIERARSTQKEATEDARLRMNRRAAARIASELMAAASTGTSDWIDLVIPASELAKAGLRIVKDAPDT